MWTNFKLKEIKHRDKYSQIDNFWKINFTTTIDEMHAKRFKFIILESNLKKWTLLTHNWSQFVILKIH